MRFPLAPAPSPPLPFSFPHLSSRIPTPHTQLPCPPCPPTTPLPPLPPPISRTRCDVVNEELVVLGGEGRGHEHADIAAIQLAGTEAKHAVKELRQGGGGRQRGICC